MPEYIASDLPRGRNPHPSTMKGNVQLGCLRGVFPISSWHKPERSKSAPAIRPDHDQAPPSPSASLEKVTAQGQGTLKPEDISLCGACCALHSNNEEGSVERTGQIKPPSYHSEDPALSGLLKPEFLDEVDAAIDTLNPELQKLSSDIWSHPELSFKEVYAHDRLTSFMKEHGFEVTPHLFGDTLGFHTAWRAEYSHGKGGRVIGLQSEMDALPNIGHACGHNLIAISGVAVALGLKSALKKYDIPGKIILLGTPAEEHGGGKIKLLEAGAYGEMNVCLMAHPGPGVTKGTTIQPWIAVQNIDAEFHGHSAHAAFAPWEAENAMDATFVAYAAICALRQQFKPTYRVHGVITGKDWEPNVIPDNAKMRYGVRAPTWAELEALCKKITACFQAAALATSTKVTITEGVGYKDCRQSELLGAEYARVAETRYAMEASITDTVLEASTDFGDISYALPTIQSVFSIPSSKNGSNHTPQFAESSITPEAHEATISASKALAATALRVLVDDEFYGKVRSAHELLNKPSKPSPQT